MGLAPRGFTLIDVLVSMAVVAILIGLLFPSLAAVGETARRVICQSNLRQLGMTLAMYADTNDDRLPSSVFLPPPNQRTSHPQLDEMVMLRVDPTKVRGSLGWDGLGKLFALDFVSAPKLFYCPSHKGNHPFRRYDKAFYQPTNLEIVGNYHYRGVGPNQSIELHGIKPESAAIVADGMRTRADFNHKGGFNVLRANMAVQWVKDEGSIAGLMPAEASASGGTAVTEKMWRMLDQAPGG